MIRRTIFVATLALFAFSCDTLSQLVTSVYAEPTQAEIGSGLKEALEIGIGKGSDALSQIDGYFKSPYKILLPEEARKITNKLKNVPGFSDLENVILEKINRGAEDAAKQAKPIFVDAIRAMTFSDALSILTEEHTQATGLRAVRLQCRAVRPARDRRQSEEPVRLSDVLLARSLPAQCTHNL